MQDHRRLSFARLLAPLALIACAVVVVAMVLGSGVVGNDETDSNATSDLPAATERTTTAGRPAKRERATYTIKANDTLSGIADQHGTTVERLQELNPELDPQGLVAGQKIKLRE
jgi:resuscitation-promoting factor RpfA